MEGFSFLQFAGTCIIFFLLAPVVPALALKPKLRGRRFAVRVVLELAIGDAVMILVTLVLSVLHLGGAVLTDLILIAVYTWMALWAYEKHPWVIFTQFTRYSRRILLGVVGWKMIARNVVKGVRRRLLEPDSFGDRVLKRHAGEWFLSVSFVIGGAALFCLRRRGIYGLTDLFEKAVMEHGVNAAVGHPFRGSATTFLPAMMCDCVAYVSRIEGYAVVRTWLFVMTMQLSAVLAAFLICQDARLTFQSLLIVFIAGLVMLSYFPRKTVEVPDNDTAGAMFTVRNGNRDHTWTMIAVDDSLGIARAYGIYYPAESLFRNMGSAAQGTEPVSERRTGDIFLTTEKIYVCVDHVPAVDAAAADTELFEQAGRLSAWIGKLAVVYPQNVEVISDTEDCTLCLIRQDPEIPLNLAVGESSSGGVTEGSLTDDSDDSAVDSASDSGISDPGTATEIGTEDAADATGTAAEGAEDAG